ncbi:hypothetical protein M422DRAFT_256544 [Sphaerobolus stellatus SS14]|uniref:Uncharacterized protein n=1 Tax=Sphaerobolus stellatus (strain SS14) TaxID=990650 RepID=A0A0C9VRG8_SPHS4|nr:hypothetical protein M422DRAFT_256544 [Sphaerobolus stellatus SS14]
MSVNVQNNSKAPFTMDGDSNSAQRTTLMITHPTKTTAKKEKEHMVPSSHTERKGAIPLVVHADNADIIASLVQVKHQVHDAGFPIKVTIVGGTEAHCLQLKGHYEKGNTAM